MEAQQKVTLILILLLGFSSLLLTGALLSLPLNAPTSREDSVLQNSEYSYTWEDYPLEIPVVRPPTVEITIEESVHYPIIGPEAHAEWLYDAPHGEGTFRLGPSHRHSTISMFHQLHCLRIFRAAIAAGAAYPMKYQKKHLNHCLNYLREATLCAADTTLEPGDFTTRNFDEHRTGATHTCRDHLQLYKLSEDDWVDWYIYMKRHNISLEALREEDRIRVGAQAPIV